MKYPIATLLISFLCNNFASAQESNYDSSLFENNWSFTLGVNVVDDSGTGFSGIADTENWNTETPIMFSIEHYLNSKFSISATVTLNKYGAGKSVDGGIVVAGFEPSYMAFDVAGKYSFRDAIKSSFFDPFVFLGLGYTSIGEYQVEQDPALIPAKGRMTLNAGLGANLWFSENWGLTLNAAGKFGASADVANQKQYSLGLIYLLPRKTSKEKEVEGDVDRKLYDELIKENFKN